jgi:hypothetical protein
LHKAQPGKTAEKRGSVIVRPESRDEHLGIGPQRGKIGLLPIADDSQTRHTGQGALPRLVRDQHRDRASGHFLTKSQRYSTTFRAIRDERRTWRLDHDLAALDTRRAAPDEHQPGGGTPRGMWSS